jgi:3-deoxy-D-manno-octulosonic-acid transferase
MNFSPALLLYRLAWEPALALVRLLALLEKAAGGTLWPRRWQLRMRLSARADNAARNGFPTVWMHAASLGECKGLWATAEALARRQPFSFVLTANTVEGYEFLASQAGSESLQGAPPQIRLAPLDHPREVRKFLRRHNVRALALFEVDLWPHFILASRRAGIPVLWISARLRRTPFPGALRTLLGNVSWTLAQTDADTRTIREHGATRVETGADLRGLHYLNDRLNDGAAADAPRAGIALVSLHAEELPALVPALENTDAATMPLFVFPRKMESLPKFLARLEPLGFELRSRNPRAARQIVDAFGLVPEILIRCRAVVMGGSFAPFGGHNLWEPLAAGTRMSIGPHHESQEYLAGKLAIAGLLDIRSHAHERGLDLKALHDRPDPRAACRLFAEAERALLRQSVEKIAQHAS